MPRIAPVSPAKKNAPVASVKMGPKPPVTAKTKAAAAALVAPQKKPLMAAPARRVAPPAPVSNVDVDESEEEEEEEEEEIVNPRFGRTVAAPPKARPTMGASVAAAAPPAPRDSDNAGIRAALVQAKEEIAKLHKMIAKTKGPIERTKDDILEGIEIEDGDWRADYQGATIYVKGWDRDAKGGEAKLTGDASYPVLCAIPRDSDGSWGTDARARGELALHMRRTEKGTYLGEPHYVDADELATIWDHEKNG